MGARARARTRRSRRARAREKRRARASTTATTTAEATARTPRTATGRARGRERALTTTTMAGRATAKDTAAEAMAIAPREVATMPRGSGVVKGRAIGTEIAACAPLTANVVPMSGVNNRVGEHSVAFLTTCTGTALRALLLSNCGSPRIDSSKIRVYRGAPG